jgi:2-succinyl-5-enolpyruvyl-6-hydroxy-3-cyclohexene-1-carboxylate synthase
VNPSGRPSRLRIFVEELARAGIRDAVVCPGSRSTPLALALRAHARIRVRVLIDERSAGFFALGIARTTGRPVVLLATSGTAAVNFAPAVVEASLARVPLVVLTADRPAELRDRGAPQTIDQDHLYGRHAKWFAELALMEGAPDATAHVRSVAGRAVATALEGPAGPVHLNLPLRDPLIPTEELGELAPAHPAAPDAPFSVAVPGRRTLDPEQVAAIARRLAGIERGLIVAGPLDDPATHEPIARLAAATGYPILADPLSGMRRGPHDRSLVLAHGDHIVRAGPWIDAHHPEIVLRFGAMPTSKPVTELIKAAAPELFVVDADGGWRESAVVATTFVRADAGPAALALSDAVATLRSPSRRPSAWPRGSWAQDWLAAELAAGTALDAWLDRLDEPFEGAPFKALGELLPAGALLWAGNSMPVRDMDDWLPAGERAVRVLGNRGANGIDGVTSTALGSAAAAGGPVALVVGDSAAVAGDSAAVAGDSAAVAGDSAAVAGGSAAVAGGSAAVAGGSAAVAGGPVALVVGDVSFLHDLGALVTARLHGPDLLVVLVNNDGGGIFSLLPQARTTAPSVGLPAHYEELFGTPHGIEIGPIVQAFGFEYRLAGSGGLADLRTAIETEIGRPGLRFVELRTDRARNAELHAAAAAAVAGALAALATEGSA